MKDLLSLSLCLALEESLKVRRAAEWLRKASASRNLLSSPPHESAVKARHTKKERATLQRENGVVPPGKDFTASL